MAHYRGRVHAWDVVNEAVADNGASLRDTLFRQRLGDEYVTDAFRLARAASAQALLFYNDYGGEGLSAKADRIYALLQNLLSKGVPIDGVGLQMHISATRPPVHREHRRKRPPARRAGADRAHQRNGRQHQQCVRHRPGAPRGPACGAYRGGCRRMHDGAAMRSDHVLGIYRCAYVADRRASHCCSTAQCSRNRRSTASTDAARAIKGASNAARSTRRSSAPPSDACSVRAFASTSGLLGSDRSRAGRPQLHQVVTAARG